MYSATKRSLNGSHIKTICNDDKGESGALGADRLALWIGAKHGTHTFDYEHQHMGSH